MAKQNTTSSALRLFVTVPIMVLMLAGCAMVNDAQDSTRSNRIENAEPHNAAVTTSVESLQQQIWEGGWAPAVGGNLLVPCESNTLGGDHSAQEESDYRFYGSWFTTDGYKAPVDLEATAQEFSSWLSTEGWSDVEMESSESPEYWRVWATREDTAVVEAMVTWYPAGNVDATQPHVVLDVDSTCSPADTKA